MTKAAYLALPNPERYAAAQAILKVRVCLRSNGRLAERSKLISFGEYLRKFGINTYRLEYEHQRDCCFIEADNIENLPEGFEIILNHEFESKALIFEPTN
jgi:hypothetical protein